MFYYNAWICSGEKFPEKERERDWDRLREDKTVIWFIFINNLSFIGQITGEGEGRWDKLFTFKFSWRWMDGWMDGMENFEAEKFFLTSQSLISTNSLVFFLNLILFFLCFFSNIYHWIEFFGWFAQHSKSESWLRAHAHGLTKLINCWCSTWPIHFILFRLEISFIFLCPIVDWLAGWLFFGRVLSAKKVDSVWWIWRAAKKQNGPIAKAAHLSRRIILIVLCLCSVMYFSLFFL